MHAVPRFTLVCVRRLEQEVLPDGGELSLSHDRRLLSRIDEHGRCFCYSCDTTRAEFCLAKPVAEQVEQSVWQHIPPETQVELCTNSLSEYPGVACLVTLHAKNSALTFSRFVNISPDTEVQDSVVQLVDDVEHLESGAPLLKWSEDGLVSGYNIWRHTIPLFQVLRLLPACREHLAAAARAALVEVNGDAGAHDADWFEGEECAIETCRSLPVRILVATAQTMVLLLDDAVATVLTFRWKGLFATSCFYMQRICPSLQPEQRRLVPFSDVRSCRDWLFAVTPQPQVRLLMWHISGVAFHALPLGEHIPEEVNFTTLSIARDLLSVALCDDRHRIWVVSLDNYFETCPKNLDWELLKERHRCAEGVGVMGQTTKAYQDLTVYPEAFGLRLQDSVKRSSSEVGGRASGRSVMDCLVEGVPTYGISLPGGATGIGDHFLESFEGKGEDDRAAGASSSLHRDSGGARCMPFAWHERFLQTRGSEWLEVERPQRTFRPMAESRVTSISTQSSNFGTPLIPKQVLTGFSVPAQHRLGDDDLNYNLCAAVHRHAQRQYQSRLPPWLVKISLPRKAKRFNPPMLGSFFGQQEDEGSSSGSELVTEDGAESETSAKAAESEASDASLAQESGPSRLEVRGSRRRKGRPGHVELAVTASHVFCEIWEATGLGDCTKPKDRGPWRLVVLPRSPVSASSGSSNWIGGGLEEDLSGLSRSVAAAASAEEDAGVRFSHLEEAAVAFRSRESWRSLLTQNHIWYLLSRGRSLHVLLLNQSPVRVITNLLIFENRTKAAALCALNDWNPKQLPLLTLFLGLRFRELDEIRQSLGLLRPDQEMQGCQMVMDFIHAGYSCSNMAPAFSPAQSGASVVPPQLSDIPAAADVPQLPPDRSFVSRLLEQAMQFVTRLVQTRVVQIRECNGACRALTYLQPAHAADEPERYALMVYELTRLTVYMQSLRNIQQQLVRSFGEETACNSGIIVKCQPRGLDVSTNPRGKTGLPSMDAALALAAKLQLGDRPSPALTAESTEALVRNALMAGRISSALNLFHELKDSDGATGDVFEEFRVTAGRLAYQLVCNQQLDFLFVAMHMLRNVGESVNRFFKAVAFHTSKRLVRRRLLRHVGHMRRLTQEEQSLICLVNLLERLYTNPCYTTEFNRMTTGLTTGQYPQRAHNSTVPPFCTWPAGGQPMLLVGLVCDGAIGGHIAAGRRSHDEKSEAGREAPVSSHWVDPRGGPQFFEQQTSLRELPMAQRMPLELYDMWSGYQTPAMAAMLELPAEARRAWASMPCGDVEDLDATPVLGLSNFHKGSNVVQDANGGADIADMREQADGEGDSEMLNSLESAPGLARASCRRCRLEGPEDDHETISPVLPNLPDGFLEALGLDDAGSKSHTMGYLHVTLSWMRQLSWETRARIVMEKTHFWPRLVEPLAWLQPPPEAGLPAKAWQHCWLDFLVAHQDWRGLAAWVRSLPLKTMDLVDEEGKSGVDLEKFEQRGLRFCTSYAREVLLQQLGRRGIFSSGDTATLEALLCRLTLCGKLFGEGHVRKTADGSQDVTLASKLPGDSHVLGVDGEGGVLPLDQLLPMGRVSPFHCFFINFCINNDLPALLLLYLQRYDLATTMSSLKELKIQQSERPWAPLLLVGRLGNPHLFAASLHHAAFVYMSDIPSDRLREDAEGVPFLPLASLAESRPIAFLATLMFAPVYSAIELLDLDQDSPWAVNKQTLQKAVAAYPALCETFFPQGLEESKGPSPKVERKYRQSLVEAVTNANATRKPLQPGSKDSRVLTDGGIQQNGHERQKRQRPMAVQEMATFKGDITLSTLLSDVAAFDVDRVLDRLCIFEVKENEAIDLASLSGQKEEQFPDELEESYFLSQGRAMMAYHVLMTKCRQSLKPGEELRFPLSLEPEDARRLRKAAKSVALHNLLNEGVVSSAVCLLELCGLETEKLRVDVEAAKRIYSHTVHSTASGPGDHRAAASVIQLFMSFPDTEDASASAAAEAAITSPHLLNALRMLEESTWALDPHPSAPAASIQALGYDLPWHLVALFCRVHSLPRSLTLLHELARNNDWVMFLYESDLQQCPADTVLDIVAGYFTELPLQSHLQILANSIASQIPGESGNGGSAQREGKGSRGAVDPGMPANAIGFLERNRSGAAPMGRGLLGHALLHRKARLAVVASAFSDVGYLQCMAVWLTVAEKDQHEVESGEHARPSPNPAEVAAQIANLCRKRHAFSLVLRALKIFDPQNPLIDFVCFHRAFVQCRFKSCREHLRRFVGRRQESGSYSLAFSPHVERLSEEMVWYLLDGFPRARMMLLSALDEAGFSPRFSQLFSAFRLIQQTGLDVDFRVPSTELLQLLISKKMFAEARAWAKNGQNGAGDDGVVFEEVTGMIVEFRQGAWWNVLSERVQLWHKCFDAFMSQCNPPSGSANFFLDIAAKLEPDLFAREQLVLLAIARELLLLQASQDVKGSHEEQLEQLKVGLLLILTGTTPDLTADLELSPLDLSYKTICSLVQRIPEHVKALPLQGEGALIDIKAKSSFGASSKDSGSQSVLSPQGGHNELVSFLETGISSLINCDELSLANHVASGFGFESSDQKLAITLASIAGGNHLEAIRVSPLEPSEAAVASAEQGDAEPLLKELGSSGWLRMSQVISTVAQAQVQHSMIVHDSMATNSPRHCSPRIALYCRRCMMFYSVSKSIDMDYQQVKKVEPTRLLSLLLSPQPYVADFDLCRNLITCFSRPLDAAAVAEVLANAFVESMLSNGVMPWRDEKLDEFVSLLSPSQELLGNAALLWVPSFRRASKVDYASQIARQVDPETEVEVLVMAYHSYVQGCCERSVSELLSFLHLRAELYVNRGHFHLLVRLLVAVPEYHAMEYMFGLLVHHGQLQLLLAEGKRAWQDAAAKTGQHSTLAVALIRYLQVHFPLQLEVQVQVHCNFGLEAELAELLETKAGEIAERLGRKWTNICSEDGEEQLILCLSMYLQCARLFLKGKRHQRHLIANERATLICLQLKAVQIHLAASLHEQQNAAAAGQENMDWADVPADGPEALADALVDATGRQKGWADAASEDNGGEEEVAEAANDISSTSMAAVGREGKVIPENTTTLSISLGPAGDVFVVINLMQKEVEVFAEYHQDFIATFEVVSAYRHCYDGLSKVWPKALYRQVVLLGNRSYLQLFLQHLPLTKDWLHAIVQLCVDEPCPEQFPSRMMRMKQFLREGVPNLETRYQLARELGSGFTDIAIETASSVYMT